MDFFDLLSMIGGLALFLYGMQMMSTGLEVAAGNRMKQILEKLTSSTFKGVLVGTLITAIIQSSSATVGILESLALAGLITLDSGIYVMFGATMGGHRLSKRHPDRQGRRLGFPCL